MLREVLGLTLALGLWWWPFRHREASWEAHYRLQVGWLLALFSGAVDWIPDCASSVGGLPPNRFPGNPKRASNGSNPSGGRWEIGSRPKPASRRGRSTPPRSLPQRLVPIARVRTL